MQIRATEFAYARGGIVSRCRPKHAFRFLPTHNDAGVQYVCALLDGPVVIVYKTITRTLRARGRRAQGRGRRHERVHGNVPGREKVDLNIRFIRRSSDVCRPRQNYYRPFFSPSACPRLTAPSI